MNNLHGVTITPAFEPTRAAALARTATVNPAQYSRTRNYLDGAVTHLSPYITHGLTNVPDVLHSVGERHKLSWEDKFVSELGWREYFQHAWRCLGDGIWQPQQAPPAPHYADQLPDDVLRAATGVPIIDAQIQALYSSGYLHNHARMWLASYLVHLRKVDWRAGAQWMYAYLLDGDLASNTLSWQWIAGTWTGKPYLFNAENVLRYAHTHTHTHNSGTAIDRSYPELEVCARIDKVFSEAPNMRGAGVATPAVGDLNFSGLQSDVPATLPPEAWLMHPWSLHLPQAEIGAPVIGVLVDEFHAQYPWSKLRYQFVLTAMRARCDVVVRGSAEKIGQMLEGSKMNAVATYNPYYAELLRTCGAGMHAQPRAFADPPQLKKSFTSFWNTVTKETFPL